MQMLGLGIWEGKEKERVGEADQGQIVSKVKFTVDSYIVVWVKGGWIC
jgi:hypothetical protein